MPRTDPDTLDSEDIVALVRGLGNTTNYKQTELIVRFIRAQRDEIDCLKHELDFHEGKLSP